MKTFMDNTKSLSKKKENVQEQPVSDTATNLQQALSSATGRRASAEDLLIISERRVRSYGDKSGIDLDHCGKQ